MRDDSFLETIKKPRYERFININKHPYRINIKEEGLNFLKIIEEFESGR